MSDWETGGMVWIALLLFVVVMAAKDSEKKK
jgi:hypothetical protein